MSSAAMAAITAAARTMYPQDALPDDVYVRVGVRLAEVAREDSGAARTIEEGVSALNGGRLFAELSADEQVEALKSIEGPDRQADHMAREPRGRGPGEEGCLHGLFAGRAACAAGWG